MQKINGDYDDCIVGVCDGKEIDTVLVYSREKILDKLCDRDGMTPSEAREFFDFNIIDAYLGKGMPVFLRDYDPEEFEEEES